MSTLQISLAIIGGLLLAGVVAYNAWITRHNAPRTARERPAESGAAAHAGPGLGEPTPAGHSQDSRLVADQSGRIEPVLDAGPSRLQTPPAPRTPPAVVSVTLNDMVQPERRAHLDALIDVITPLQLEFEVSGDAVLATLPATRRVGSKPFAVEGLSVLHGDWELPRPGQRYRVLQAGLQLANRSGALNDIEFSEYVVRTQAFADVLGATPDFPDMRAEVARGRELDAFASTHDAQLDFALRARRAAWSPGYVIQNAAQLGFVAGSLPGRMVLPGSASGQAPLLILSFDQQAAMADHPEQSALREITLSLEVTHVPRTEAPFVRMRHAAATLAAAMDGVVTDKAGQALTEATMDLIGTDLQRLYDALDARDLSAGSPQARRLFS
jgi:hypothetical protein